MSKNEQQINVGIIGAGGRSGLAVHLFQKFKNVKLKAVFDPDKKVARERLEALGCPDAKICDTYEEVSQHPDVDWVMVFSPNCHHCEHILSSFKAGKHVFSEKPLATTVEDCDKIHQAHKKSKLTFATGFVLRYAPLYRKTKELITSGEIGRIVSIDANENIAPEHGSYIMQNWRRFKKYAGPHILEKCCHDIDLLNWFVGSLPATIASFGGRDLFLPENEPMKKKHKTATRDPFTGWRDPHGTASPFTSEKDIVDNQVAIMQYRNNVRVMFQATLSNAIPERRMYFSGTEGTMISEAYSGTIRLRRIDEEPIREFKLAGGGHAGGDEIIMDELYETMANGSEPKSSGEEGLDSAVTALIIEEAREKMAVIDLEPIWRKLGR